MKNVESASVFGASLLRWYLIFTKPNGENRAKTNLERQGYRVYFPRVRQKVLKRGAWCDTISALFPRYLFIQLNVAIQSLAPIRSTLAVASVVRFGLEYVAVPENIVNSLIGREDETGMHILSSNCTFRDGAPVRVIDGALAGIEGIFEREDANDRVTVLLNLLGQETRIKLPMASVVPVSLSY